MKAFNVYNCIKQILNRFWHIKLSKNLNKYFKKLERAHATHSNNWKTT